LVLPLRREKLYYAYIVANATRILYTGFSGDFVNRIWKHKTKQYDDGFTCHWRECRLVYYESYKSVHAAVAREKQIKRWRREKKVWLIEQMNPNCHDLSDGWYDDLTKK
jgi:putative endonuclease